MTKNIGLKLGYNYIDLQKTDVWGSGKAPHTNPERRFDLKYSFDHVYHNYVVAIKYLF